MSSKWPLVRLGEVMTERRETPSEEDLMSGRVRIIEKIGFDTGSIQLRSNGSTRTGMILVRPGDLVVSGINAAKGAIAIYDTEATEPVAATIHYAAYIPNSVRVDVRFLWWMLRSRFFQELLNEYLPGGIKTELKAKRLLQVPVPMPPLTEQRRIVARIEELAAKIEEARRLRREAVEEVEVFLRSKYASTIELTGVERLPLSKVADEVGEIVAASENRHMIYLGLEDVEADTGTVLFKQTAGERGIRGSAVKFSQGTVLYSKLRPYLNKVVVPSFAGIATTEFVVLRPRERLLSPEFLAAWLRSPRVVEELNRGATGTKMPRTNMKGFRQTHVPIPSLADQRRIVAELDALQAEVDRLKALQAETAAELDALLPAILDRAFKGKR